MFKLHFKEWHLAKNVAFLAILRGQISRFLPISFPGSSTQFGTWIPGSDSGTGRSNPKASKYVPRFITA